LAFVYASNRRALNPSQLYFLGLRGKLGEVSMHPIGTPSRKFIPIRETRYAVAMNWSTRHSPCHVGNAVQLYASHAEWSSWDVNVDYERTYAETFVDKETIVYLTSESDNVLQQLDDDTVYVIGELHL